VRQRQGHSSGPHRKCTSEMRLRNVWHARLPAVRAIRRRNSTSLQISGALQEDAQTHTEEDGEQRWNRCWTSRSSACVRVTAAVPRHRPCARPRACCRSECRTARIPGGRRARGNAGGVLYPVPCGGSVPDQDAMPIPSQHGQRADRPQPCGHSCEITRTFGRSDPGRTTGASRGHSLSDARTVPLAVTGRSRSMGRVRQRRACAGTSAVDAPGRASRPRPRTPRRPCPVA
jgi:hypothetical protein